MGHFCSIRGSACFESVVYQQIRNHTKDDRVHHFVAKARSPTVREGKEKIGFHDVPFFGDKTARIKVARILPQIRRQVEVVDVEKYHSILWNKISLNGGVVARQVGHNGRRSKPESFHNRGVGQRHVWLLLQCDSDLAFRSRLIEHTKGFFV